MLNLDTIHKPTVCRLPAELVFNMLFCGVVLCNHAVLKFAKCSSPQDVASLLT